ncbi:MAG: DUF2339 domain-containing protein [Candidatus Bruticola sp.]
MAILTLVILFLPLILSVVALISCHSVKERVQKLEAAVSSLKAAAGKQLPPPSAYSSIRSEAVSGQPLSSPNEPTQAKVEAQPVAENSYVHKIEETAPTTSAWKPSLKAGLNSDNKFSSLQQPSKSVPVKLSKDAEQSFNSHEQASANSLEQLFLGSLFDKLGALAFLIFVILFIKWLSPYLALTASMKVGAIYTLSLAFMAIGACSLPKQNMRGVAETLLGLGLASAIMITYAGSVYFELWDNYVTLVLASLILLGTYILAYFVQKRSVICLGALAGYANLVFIQTSIDSTFVFDFYLVILTLFCLIGTVRGRNWGALFSVHLIVSWIFILVRCLFNSESDFSTVALGAMWFVVLIYDLFRTEEGYTPRQLQFSVYLNHFVMILGSIIIYENGEFLATSVCAAVLLWALAKLHWDNKKILAGTLVNSSLLILALSTYGFEEPISRVVFLSALSLVSIAAAVYKTENSYLRDNLCFWNGCCNIMAFVVLLFADLGGRIDFFLTPDRNFWHLGALLSLISASSWLLSYLLIKYSPWSVEKEKLKNFSLWAAITLVYIYCGREIADLLERVFSKGFSGHALSWFSSVTVCSIYALHTALQAKVSKSKSFVVGYNLALIMSVWALLVYAPASIFLNRLNDFMPIVNLGFLAHAMTILALAAVFVISQTSVYAVGAIFVGWSLVHFEGGNIVNICGMESITSVLWMLYAAAVIFVGIGLKKSYVTKCGIFIVCITLLRVVTYDIISLPIGYKLLLFFVLGCAFLIVSYYYSKRAAASRNEENTTPPVHTADSPSVFSVENSVNSLEGIKAADTQLLDNTEGQKVVTTSPFGDKLPHEDGSTVASTDAVEEQDSKTLAETFNQTAAAKIDVGHGASSSTPVHKASWHTDS